MSGKRRTTIEAEQAARDDRDACEVAEDRTIYDAFVDGAEGRLWDRPAHMEYVLVYDDIAAIDDRIDREEHAERMAKRKGLSTDCKGRKILETAKEKAARKARAARALQEARLASAEKKAKARKKALAGAKARAAEWERKERHRINTKFNRAAYAARNSKAGRAAYVARRKARRDGII